MSGVFQNIDPPPPHRPASVFPPLVREEDTGWRGGWGVKSLEDARRCSVLCICKYMCLDVMHGFLYEADNRTELPMVRANSPR
jgi:hypothetical protein